MSEAPKIPPKGNNVLKGKVFGVPTVYLIGGFIVILAVIAWRMKASKAPVSSSDPGAVDAANASGSDTANPPMPVGTVVAAPPAPSVAPVAYSDNSTWMRQAVAYLIEHGANPGNAQLAIQHYLAGATLSYDEGAMRDEAVRQYGLPPDGFDAGPTLPRPAPPPSPVTTPVVHAPTPPKPVSRPPVPVPVTSVVRQRTYIVRPGDNLTRIAATFHYPGGWPALYAANKAVIGPNPNLIHPGQRLVVG